jgi:antitoxin (DNA-binding transcriptional repressor) of toxin-antitoxin stability system
MESERRRELFKQQRETAAARAKAAGPSAAVAAREVTMTQLDRRAAAIVRDVRKGEVAVVSKHKRAVAMIVPLDDELELVLRDPAEADGLAELISTFKERARDRHTSEVMHGRWFGRRYKRYRRPRRWRG